MTTRHDLMDILQVHTPYRQRGGEDYVVEREADLLMRAGHRVRQHIVPNPSDTAGTVRALAGSMWNPVSYVSGARLAASDKPAVAHVHNTWFALSPSVITGLKRKGTPIVMTLHNYRLLCLNGLLYRDDAPCMDCLGRFPIPGVVHRCYQGSFALSTLSASTIGLNRLLQTWSRHVDPFIAMTEFGRQVFIRGGLPPERIVVKPHFVSDPGERAMAPAESSTVLYVGRITEEKGLGLLMEAWDAAALDGLELLVIGEGPLRNDLQKEGLASVRFLGRLNMDELTRTMLEARALVFPSKSYETFGLVVIEALAAGLPVLASDIGGNTELLAGLGQGWLVDTNEKGSWTRSLGILTQDALVNLGGAKARAAFEARYSERVGLSNLEELYRRVVFSTQ